MCHIINDNSIARGVRAAGLFICALVGDPCECDLCVVWEIVVSCTGVRLS